MNNRRASGRTSVTNEVNTDIAEWVERLVIDDDYSGDSFPIGDGSNNKEQTLAPWPPSKNESGSMNSKTSDSPSVAKATKQHAGKEDFESKFDSSLARELTELSLHERERKYEELHGVEPPIEETPEFVKESLQKLERELLMIPQKTAYLRAWCTDRTYVESDDFRLMFLRAELFDARMAAVRLVFFMEKKLEYYGPETLTRSLRLSDLNEDDLQTLKGGAIQILPSRDRSGRLILFSNFFSGPKLYSNFHSLLKSWYYQAICAIEDDEESQRKGCINICWAMDYIRVDEEVNAHYAEESRLANHWLPMRWLNGIHMCIDPSPGKQLFARVLCAVIDRRLRPKFKIHVGTQTEVFYHLLSFGIPVDDVPVSSTNGKILTANQAKWIKRRLAKDGYRQDHPGRRFEKTELPRPTDILLLNRRMLYHRHPGNQNFRLFVESALAQFYETDRASPTSPTLPKETRQELSRLIISTIETHHGRFLKKDKDDWWVVAPYQETQDKVHRTIESLQATVHANTMAKSREPAMPESTSPTSAAVPSLTESTIPSVARLGGDQERYSKKCRTDHPDPFSDTEGSGDSPINSCFGLFNSSGRNV